MQPPTRAILPESRIHPAIRERIATSHREIVETVEAAVRNEAVVVVGMAGNPFPRKARGLLDAQGTMIAHRTNRRPGNSFTRNCARPRLMTSIRIDSTLPAARS